MPGDSMGLLEDAIREHMKMKRDRGASKDTISRIEDEAFGSDPQLKEPSPITAEPKKPVESKGEAVVEAPVTEVPKDESVKEPAPDPEAKEPLETEVRPIDEAETKTDAEEEPGAVDESNQEAEAEPGETSVDEEPLPEDDKIEEGPSEGRPLDTAEHLLEETPEFLEDTPEGERLWFEQRPPKDFDFND